MTGLAGTACDNCGELVEDDCIDTGAVDLAADHPEERQ